MKTLILLVVLSLSSLSAFSQNKGAKHVSKPLQSRSGVKPKSPILVRKKAQSLSELFYIYKEGEWIKYKGSSHSLGELYKELGIDGRTYSTSPDCGIKGKKNGCFVMVGYKLFTREPQWALMHDTLGISGYVSEFDLEELLNTWRFKFELERAIEKHSLDDAFLIEVLGAPDRKVSFFDVGSSTEVWDYDQYGLSITLKRGIAVSFVKVDD